MYKSLKKSKTFKKLNNYLYENNEPMPFELEYQKSYRKVFLNKLKNEDIFKFDIKNLSKKKELIKDELKNKIFLTSNKKNRYKECYKNKCNLLNKIFPDNELIKYNNVPFLYLLKKDKNNSDNRILKEDFLYKISHGDRFFTINNNNNFIKNKSMKKGLTMNYFNNKKQNLLRNEFSLPELRLELDINNLSNIDEKRISHKEKYFLLLKNKLKDLKNGNIFKNLKEDILNFNEENDKMINNSLNLEKINNIKEMKGNNISVDSFKRKNNYDNKSSKIYINNYFSLNNENNSLKKPLKYPINFYSNKQLEMKKKRYEKTHREGWKEFKRKINLKNRNHKNILSLCILEPNINLTKKKIMTNKIAYLIESKKRDILISNKLKCEFDDEDIKRIINGKKPFKDLFLIENKYNNLI